MVKNLPANAGDIRDAGSIPELGRSPGEELAIYSSILVWEIPWTEDNGFAESDSTEHVCVHTYFFLQNSFV